MTATWFPGHMRRITERLRSSDVIIEVLDARAPRASQHPLVREHRGKKPVLRVLNKADLADPAVTRAWIRSFKPAMTLSASFGHRRSLELRRILQACRRLAGHRKAARHPVEAIVVGIPNVGKSTLVNGLKGKRALAVRNEPGVTRREQGISITPGFFVWDTVGVLWPSLWDHDHIVRLAALGTIPGGVLEATEVAMFVLEHIRLNYPRTLGQNYGLTDLSESSLTVLEAIGRRRGLLKPGQAIDLTGSSRRLLGDLQGGRLGRISLEAPEPANPVSSATASHPSETARRDSDN